jgi:MFS family permease
VLAPEVRADLVNRWAEVPIPDDHERAVELVGSRDRSGFYARYPFDVAPPTDDRPFFFHFFRLEQTSALVEELGRRWQPFGGGGYFILVALLGFAVIVAGAAVVMPLLARRRFRAAFRGQRELAARTMAYVVAIGLAFLFVEVTLVQRAILVLGDPTHAFATVVGTLLVASGVGSALSARLPWRPSMLTLVAALGLHAGLSWVVGPALLALPDPLPLAVVVAVIAPVGFLMGVPFPRIVNAIGPSPELVAWAWAANGSASVVSGILATLIALSFGFGVVLAAAAALYLLAVVLAPRRPMGPASAVAA